MQVNNEAQRKFSSLGSTVVFDSVSPISENNFRTKLENTSLSVQTFGGDAFLGNTRSHPEHDG